MSIIFKGKDSELDFDIYPASKDLSPPKKKRIRETVPFMNGEWYFSKIGGEQYYEPRICKYNFDIIGDTEQEKNALKDCIVNWLTVDCEGESLKDTDIADYHFVVINADATFAEDGLQGLLTVEFTCKPYKAKDEGISIQKFPNPAKTVNLPNNGSHRVAVTVVSISNAQIVVNGTTYAVSEGTYTELFYVPVGGIDVDISGYGQLTFSYNEEVL